MSVVLRFIGHDNCTLVNKYLITRGTLFQCGFDIDFCDFSILRIITYLKFTVDQKTIQLFIFKPYNCRKKKHNRGEVKNLQLLKI